MWKMTEIKIRCICGNLAPLDHYEVWPRPEDRDGITAYGVWTGCCSHMEGELPSLEEAQREARFHTLWALRKRRAEVGRDMGVLSSAIPVADDWGMDYRAQVELIDVQKRIVQAVMAIDDLIAQWEQEPSKEASHA